MGTCSFCSLWYCVRQFQRSFLQNYLGWLNNYRCYGTFTKRFYWLGNTDASPKTKQAFVCREIILNLHNTYTCTRIGYSRFWTALCGYYHVTPLLLLPSSKSAFYVPSEFVRIGSTIISNLGTCKLWKAKFFLHVLCDVNLLVRLQGREFENLRSSCWPTICDTVFQNFGIPHPKVKQCSSHNVGRTRNHHTSKTDQRQITTYHSIAIIMKDRFSLIGVSGFGKRHLLY